ncbi:putative LRR receptor-like serine/threonine-protein kinase [Glycine soja]
MENRVPFFFFFLFSFSLLLLLLLELSSAQMPGFVSLDCGGKENFTDEIGLNWTPDKLRYGEISNISVANETRKQYTALRHFPADSRKYCYTLDVVSRTRYLLRASFLYGNFDANNVYPKFDIFIGATHWSTIVISDANTIEMRELIFLALSPTVSVCLSNATTGKPFISTLELRQFNGSVYYTYTEEHFYLSVSARINFGADSDAPIRYPDDPFDRIWESDSVKKANYLVDVAAGTRKISTNKSIDVNSDEMPPMKVMQTAVVGTNGSLTYRLNLDGFPGFAWAFTYFAEIEDLAENESRKFRLVLPGHSDISKAVVNIEENAPGKYRLYEPGYTNLSLPFVLSFRFGKTSDSSRGPLLNAMEINEYLEKNDGSPDGEVISSVLSHYFSADWAQEGGDPCLPVPWSWVRCSSDQQPKIISILLSSKNLTGNIPLDITKLTGLVELRLDGNMLTGPIPDFTGCMDLKIIHLENNQLTGALPTSLANLPNLRELLVSHPSQSMDSSKSIGPSEVAHCFSFSEIENSTNNFEKKIGSGGFGVVYYGKLKDGKEIAVKVLTSNSYQGKREFSNEVTLLSRIHHRNLVQLLGYCREEGNSMLIYEFMHNGTLKEHLYGPLTHGRSINWMKRLEIAEDSAKGIEYLHTGCVPAVIHRDLKSSNILLDKHMRAKVSDFGLSKLAVDGASHVSSIVRGTLTDKSDIYSFGVILLELISGQEAISNDSFGANCRNIVQWAKLHIESGDIQGIIDPVLQNNYDLQSMWKIAEKALMCVQPHGHMRPSISEVLKEIQDAIAIEREAEGNSDEPRNSVHSSINMGSMDLAATENYLSIDESIAQPIAR